MSDMQTQARICPMCHDDHIEGRPCSPSYEVLRTRLTALEVENERLCYALNEVEDLAQGQEHCSQSDLFNKALNIASTAISCSPLTHRLQKIKEAREAVCKAARNIYCKPGADLNLLDALRELEKLEKEGV